MIIKCDQKLMMNFIFTMVEMRWDKLEWVINLGKSVIMFERFIRKLSTVWASVIGWEQYVIFAQIRFRLIKLGFSTNFPVFYWFFKIFINFKFFFSWSFIVRQHQTLCRWNLKSLKKSQCFLSDLKRHPSFHSISFCFLFFKKLKKRLKI